MFCEKVCSFHKNKANCLLHLVGVILLIYALWQHNFSLILISILIFIIGHIIQFVQDKKDNKGRKRKRQNKKAALELSISTIVVLVIAMTMLILGIVFVRNIICSGIILTDQISASVSNEITDLFGSREMGVKCMGETGKEVKIGDGGKRQIFCVINTDEKGEYKLTMKSIESIGGVSTREVEKWVIDKNWRGEVKPGMTTAVFIVLNIPKRVSNTELKITLEEEETATGNKQTHISYINVAHVGAIKTAIC